MLRLRRPDQKKKVDLKYNKMDTPNHAILHPFRGFPIINSLFKTLHSFLMNVCSKELKLVVGSFLFGGKKGEVDSAKTPLQPLHGRRDTPRRDAKREKEKKNFFNNELRNY